MSTLAPFEAAVLSLAAALRARGLRLATAESCTGGLIAAACTSVAGSSDWFERGFVTYSNAAKSELLGVSEALIAAEGAVSEAVAAAMAEGALRHSAADLSVAVTGIAGPGGGSPAKPVGLVWMGCSLRSASGTSTQTIRLMLGADRSAVREATVRKALAVLHARALASASQPDTGAAGDGR
jgi:nicotinamide-nucleotide amidase